MRQQSALKVEHLSILSILWRTDSFYLKTRKYGKPNCDFLKLVCGPPQNDSMSHQWRNPDLEWDNKEQY